VTTRLVVAVVLALAAAVAAVAAYAAFVVLAGDDEVDAEVGALARDNGWRPELGGPFPGPAAILEVAYDRETAEEAWRENVPDELPERTGDPDRPGVYGSLDDVDFDREVVVVWSAGGSSSCPPWLARVETDAAGTVTLETDAAEAEACTDDYSPYRMLLAVDRERLPAADDLPTEDVDADVPPPGALVTGYPAEPPE
jgi:hypothetical protein